MSFSVRKSGPYLNWYRVWSRCRE
uniref:Uncharacterized protein n=1 Tax=Anopheles minimus TaxID=112268 RepID=A0A182WPK0_9DIPT